MSEDKQIRNMIAFIEAEAREKAAEIEQQAQEEYDIEKQQLVEKGKALARSEAEASKKKFDVERRVKQANQMKEQHMKVLRQREVELDKLKEFVRHKCIALTQNANEYRTLLKNLLVQSLQSIQSDVEVQCRAVDESHIDAIMEGAIEEAAKKNKGKRFKVVVSKTKRLSDDIWGGIVVTGMNDKITSDCTLRQRVAVCFEEQLPSIRYMMFN